MTEPRVSIRAGVEVEELKTLPLEAAGVIRLFREGIQPPDADEVLAKIGLAVGGTVPAPSSRGRR